MIDKPFPDFSLEDQSGKVWTREDLVGKQTVLFCYPKDGTPG